MSDPRGYLCRSRSVRLIEQLIASETCDVATLARAIGLPEEALEVYRSGRARMPLEAQLCLARLVLEAWPNVSHLRRNAYALRGQVSAEMAFRARLTKVHTTPKVRSWGSLR